MMHAALCTLNAYWNSRYYSRKGLTREAFDKWQQKQLKQWLMYDVPKVKFYRGKVQELSDLPIIDKSILMANFADFNQSRISAEETRNAWQTTGKIQSLTAGASTGTSGQRGLFVITPQERFLWLGSMLAKALPNFWRSINRVAVILPQSTELYDSANQSRLLKLRFFDLRQGPENWRDDIEDFSPNIIVAPPKILRYFAEQQFNLMPKKLFSGAETLDPFDRHMIEQHYKLCLGQIYMATEGLFAVSCHKGNLHLAEDSTYFEFEDMGSGLVSPIISTFKRKQQILARYRMNDILRLSDQTCSCASPLKMVDEIIGRMDDVFMFNGGDILITPDILRNSLLDAAPDVTDFRIIRTHEDVILVNVPSDTASTHIQQIKEQLHMIFAKRGLKNVHINIQLQDFSLATEHKLRRVENRWRI